MKYIIGIRCGGRRDPQYISENGEIKLFDDLSDVDRYAKGNPEVIVKRQVGTCPRSGSPLFYSDVYDYAYQCFTCDEDFYGIEVPNENLCSDL